jgi:hypothetical protein
MAAIARTGWFTPSGVCNLEREEHEMSGTTTFALAKGRLVTFRLKAWPLRISCVSGQLWATISGSATDHLIGPGEGMSFACRGTVVVQALRESTMRVQEAPEPGAVADYPPGARTISNTPVVMP